MGLEALSLRAHMWNSCVIMGNWAALVWPLST